VVVEDVEQRPSRPLRVLVGLVEQAGHDAGAEPPRAVVVDGLLAGQQPQEVALADAVGAEHGDPLAEPQLDVERVGEPGELEALDDDGPLAGAGAAETDVDLLFADLGRPLGARLELAQPALRRLQLGREAVGHLRPSPHLVDDVDEALALVVVPRAVARQPLEAGLAGLVVAGEPAAVGPRAVGLHGDDP